VKQCLAVPSQLLLPRRVTTFRVEGTRMACIACCGVTCTAYLITNHFFRDKRHRLLVCRPNPRFNNTTGL
jgi:hypothetical protein